MNLSELQEKIPHGMHDFPFEYHYVTDTHPRYVMPLHWHKEWEIIHILEGSFTVQTDNTEYISKKGYVLLIGDGMLHGGIPTRCIYECFLFDMHDLFCNLNFATKHLHAMDCHQICPDIYYPMKQCTELNQPIYSLSEVCAPLRKELVFDGPFELIVFSYISLFLTTILQQHHYTIPKAQMLTNPHKIQKIKSIIEYMEGHYADALSLHDLAAVANMNPRYFCRFFKSITHHTPIDYLNRYRVEKSALLLQNTDLSITDICMKCGFNDSSNFTKVFRKYKDSTPKQYRKWNAIKPNA
ncbi:MAG: AraC family transcriptional regulator [Acetatifactor sp.]|nr:AraC family transcriptional regulator [Acetatifactor sp.]